MKFIEKRCKVHQHTYQNDILKKTLIPWAQQHFGKNKWVFQQDSAHAHRGKSTQNWCQNNLPDYITANEWPPCSPDLNALDYSIWSILESRACEKNHKNVKELKTSLKKAWKTIDDNTIRKIIDEFPKRLARCIKSNGGYFENS